MSDQPLHTFESHVAGKNAKVSIYADRIEWDRPRSFSLGKAMVTVGTSWHRNNGASETIPIRAISSVSAVRDGGAVKVSVYAAGSVIDFRVDKKFGEQMKTVITQLMTGSHPALAAPPSPPPVGPPASQPSVADRLTRLDQLRASGVLSDAEYQAQRQAIIAQL